MALIVETDRVWEEEHYPFPDKRLDKRKILSGEGLRGGGGGGLTTYFTEGRLDLPQEADGYNCFSKAD